MKKIFTKVLLLMTGVILFASCGPAKTATEIAQDAAIITQKMQNLNFKFEATYVHPVGFRSQTLTPGYDVKVSKDSLDVYLPYFGRLYRAPFDMREGGLKFVSTKFDYNVREDERTPGHWLVELQTRDLDRRVLLYFDIWENGKANLQVMDDNRQGINFSGDIKMEE